MPVDRKSNLVPLFRSGQKTGWDQTRFFGLNQSTDHDGGLMHNAEVLHYHISTHLGGKWGAETLSPAELDRGWG